MFVIDKENNVRMIDIKLAVLEKEYGKVFSSEEFVTAVECTPVSKQLIVGSSAGN